MRKTRLFISPQTYETLTIEKVIDFTSADYVLSPDGQHTDVTVDDWHYGAVNYYNVSPLFGWQPEPSGVSDTQQQTSYWDLGLFDKTEIQVELNITNSASPAGVIEVGFGNVFQQVTTNGVITLTFNPTAPDPFGIYGYSLVFRASGGTYLPGTPTTLYINNIKVKYVTTIYNPQFQEVDLYDEIDIPVTYNVADVQDISKKDSNFSLTVEVPNTNNNAVLFDLVHDIARFNSTFELLKQYPAFVEVDGNRTFEGYLMLTKVIISDLKEISYECNLYSNFIEFVKRLGSTTLRGNADVADDLSFSEYSKQLTESEWFDRTDMYYWDTTPNPWVPIGEKPYGTNFYFAPIDKFNFGSNRNSVTDGGEKFVPMFYDELTPFLFVREIWNKIFKWAGFSYVSDFIQDTVNNTTGFEFEKLVYPHTGATATPATLDNYNRLEQFFISPLYPDLQSRSFTGWTLNDSEYFSGYVYPIYGDQHNTGSMSLTSHNCPSSVLNSIYWKFTAGQGGVYSVKLAIPWMVEMSLIDPTPPTGTQLTYTGNAYCNEPSIQDAARFWVRLNKVHGGVTEIVAQDSIHPDFGATWNAVNGVVSDFIAEHLFDQTITVHLDVGDELYLSCGFDFLVEKRSDSTLVFSCENGGSPFGCAAWFRYIFLPLDSSVYYTYRMIDITRTSDFYLNGTFDPTIILNPKRKKVDFINDIIRKFNLYIEDVTNAKDANGVYYRDYPNGDNKRTGEPILRIEPRDMYYANNPIVKDWTAKTDVSTMNFKRIDDYLYNVLLFNDKDDKTYHVEYYNEFDYSNGEYGEKIITSPYNTDSEQKTEIKTDLGQTMCGRVGTIDVPYNTGRNTYTQCPYLYTLNNDGSIKDDKEYNDRMLFVYDLYWNDYANIFSSSELKGWRIYRRDDSHPGQFTPSYANPTKVYTYLLLDHFNSPFGTDTVDLNFGWCNWYMSNLNGTWATPNNCYKVFYADMVDDYNNADSRLLACNMYLTPSDIRDLQLSDTIIINGMAYHLNKIEQWTDGNTPVKVELIKILQSNSSVPGYKGKKDEKKKTEKTNNPPAISSLTTLSVKNELDGLGDEVQGLTKMVKENETELSGNKEAIKNIQEVLKKLDERLKKLEG